MNTSITFFLRNKLPELPYFIGKYISKIPYTLRPGIGRNYKETKEVIDDFELLDDEKRKEFIFRQVKGISVFAFENIKFYNDLYNKHKFNPNEMRSFTDISAIPITTKTMFLNYSLNERSHKNTRSLLINTGGSSGKTLSFYVPSQKIAVEWAHLHYIWNKQMSFNPAEPKLLLVGRSKVRDTVSFDFIRNSLRVDLYKPFSLVSNKILSSFHNMPIYYIHGYPSAIYELALYCMQDSVLLEKLSSRLKGIILCSEYPDIHKRQLIEQVFKSRTYAFYGQSEGSVLAYENNINKYIPVHTYGYTEILSKGSANYLLGTSYCNTSTPFIRYNIEDEILDPVYKNELLQCFSMKAGRPGEFIIDRMGKKIALTGLIYGRHHKLFDYCSSIQIKQPYEGIATVYYVPRRRLSIDPGKLFDSSNVEIAFSFVEIAQPIKTISGKQQLLVNQEYQGANI